MTDRKARRWLLGQAGGVLADLPVFLTSPIYRRWHLNWGTTGDEALARVERSLTTGSELGAWRRGQHAGGAMPQRRGITSSKIHVQL